MSVLTQLPQISLSWQFPSEWQLLKASDLCWLVTDGTHDSPKPVNKGLPLITSKNLQNGNVSFEDSYNISYNDYQQISKRSKVDQYDVLFSMIGSIGTVAFVSDIPCFAIKNVGLFKTNLDQELGLWLYYFFQSSFIKEYVRMRISGTSQKYIPLWILQELPVVFPSSTERKAIIQILQSLQKNIQLRCKELGLERERKAALMQHLFTRGTRGETTKQSEVGEIPESWEIRRLQDLSEIAYGLTVNAARTQSTLQLVPYLAVNNVTRGALRLNEVKQIGMLEGDSKRYRLQKGDVLLIEGNGNPALLGSAAVWNDELPFALHQNHLIRARPKLKLILPDWLMNYLNSDNGRTQLLGKAKTSSGLNSINSRIVSNLLVPHPCLHEQAIIIGVINACSFKINTLEKEITLHEELFRALLDELMTGRISTLPLVEQLEKGSSHDGSRTGDGTATAD